MQLYLKNWYDRFLSELPKTNSLRIVSPFVKEQVLRKMGEIFDFNNLELITRFNLRDFASQVSSLEGLKYIVNEGSKVYGIKDLHSKVYLFDKRAAIVTSANLTNGGLINNYECGVYITDEDVIKELNSYIDTLIILGDKPLNNSQCEEWQKLLEFELPNTELSSLPDFGSRQIQIRNDINYFIKFFGTSGDRIPMNVTVREEIDSALCHYACGFSSIPRQINDGDVIYMARMTHDPYDFAIFGKATAMKHVPGRDIATPQEIKERSWKAKWPIYIRVTNPIFVDGQMGDCVLMYDMIKAMDYMSFPSTKRRFNDGEREINPKRSLAQKAYIPITQEAANWLEPKFQASIDRKGIVPINFISSLPTSSF